MYKYKLRLTQTKNFDEEDKCFNAIIDLINVFQDSGFVLTKICENKYYLKKGEDKKIIEVIKEVEL